MKKILFCAVCFFVCCVLVLVTRRIGFTRIIDVPEILLVCAGGGILSLPALTGKNASNGSLRQKSMSGHEKRGNHVFYTTITAHLSVIGENMLTAGILSSVFFALTVISNPGDVQSNPEFQRDILFPLVLGCRPALYGGFLKILLSTLEKNIKMQTTDLPVSAADESESRNKADDKVFTRIFSRREYEVALLVMENCTNAEIGEELYISVPTVKRHLANMFEKAGVSTRRELAEKLREQLKKN